MKLNAKELRVSKPTGAEVRAIQRNPVYVVLDDVMDTYNIGSIFRLADAVAVKEVVLCGKTERPPSSRIHKAAVGTEEWVPWRYGEKIGDELRRLREDGVKIVVVEQDSRAISLRELDVVGPVALVVGHETVGVSKVAMDLADVIVEIPMWGVNKSLNVHVSAAVVAYHLINN